MSTKMVNKFKLTVVQIARPSLRVAVPIPNPMQIYSTRGQKRLDMRSMSEAFTRRSIFKMVDDANSRKIPFFRYCPLFIDPLHKWRLDLNNNT